MCDRTTRSVGQDPLKPALLAVSLQLQPFVDQLVLRREGVDGELPGRVTATTWAPRVM